MSDLYGDEHRRVQERFETTQLADAVRKNIVHSSITETHRLFIESRDMFFLTTTDYRGFPTCSYKGGDPGFIRVLDEKMLAFPSYDGNGMFLSVGNMIANDKIGMLLIDFETPNRIRIHGTASVDFNDPLLSTFHGAELVVRVTITDIFTNCPRYIHRYQRIERSKYVPSEQSPTPEPQWKRIDDLQPALPANAKGIAEALGGTISQEEYAEKVKKGEA
ncbi:pyridoxamine 5'-phosphate oxidase family protein [Methylobacillus arboreus]|uniref:pyridoxamine 5'-phosphate oxidase family protein n=1 Tax=Methylobacillus arboreus TaxID=755170 RepID=UPI001E52F94D|nr:pyridoxamine 5'-phosphate oxidase family protein [Methylobacillus arboreus]MCB5190907.1 pyridoxamine 5'-phosphate oxidase family protein [Methylobacillus arboreus]